MNPTNLAIQIYNTRTGARVVSCTGGTTCTGTVQAWSEPDTYTAYLAPDAGPTVWPLVGVQATSANAYIHMAPWNITLIEADGQLTATANQPMASSGFTIQIFNADTNTRSIVCYGITCTIPATPGQQYIAYIAGEGTNLQGPPPRIQASSAGLGSAGGLDLAQMEALLGAFALEGICEELTLAPVGTHTANSSTSDQALACNTALAAGMSKGEAFKIIASAGATTAAAGVLWYLLHQLDADGNPNPNPDTAAQDQHGVIPTALPQIWRGDDLSDDLRLLNPAVPPTDVNIIARTCLVFAARAGLSAYDDCRSLPIFASGVDVAEATKHDIDALGANPGWVKLEYETSATKSTSWKTNLCAQLPRNSSTDQCDEYPFLASKQGGGSAIPTPDLRYIDQTHNATQGGLYSGFLTVCGLRIKAEPVFLATPTDPAAGLPTYRLCNGAQ